MTDDTAKPPRFPYIAALLCAGCVGAAAWLWLRYSFCWDVTGEYLCRNAPAIRNGRWPCRSYVRFRGTDGRGGGPLVPDSGHADDADDAYLDAFLDAHNVDFVVRPSGTPTGGLYLTVRMPPRTEPSAGEAGEFVGRVFADEPFHAGFDLPPEERWDPYPGVDTTASRLTGASISGLVVGAMGVFVFTVALRHWLGERRKFQEEARA